MAGDGEDLPLPPPPPPPANSCFFNLSLPSNSQDLPYHPFPTPHSNTWYSIYDNLTHDPPSSTNYQSSESITFGSITVPGRYMLPPYWMPLDYPIDFPSPRECEVGNSLLPETDEGTGPLEKDSSSSKPQQGSNLLPDFLSKLSMEMEESVSEVHDKIAENEEINSGHCSFDKTLNDMDEQIEDLLNNLEDEHVNKNYNKRYEDYRSDAREQRLGINGQCRSMFERGLLQCRRDIDLLSAPFLYIYESLLPSKMEEENQKQLIASLERIVRREWPESRLNLFGSCANSFGFSKSDIDLSLEIEGPFINKSEVLLKLAQILQSHKLQNVQALTRARVPIVKLLDPVTRVSCDISINNSLAIVNTKLLRDYAQIDIRLQQLVFIVKHWAKSRKVNETSQGTLSSYAYVLMCIHFLQTRQPSILPCLQQMRWTYEVSVGSIICAYYDEVEKLSDFGSANKETIGRLVWEFFNYWAYGHDYTSEVISVRTGRNLSKQSKNWKKSIGNDRHLICIEDPFDKLHDLGRVVDYRTIHALREEFERAAMIMQFDADPCVKLFESYIPGY